MRKRTASILVGAAALSQLAVAQVAPPGGDAPVAQGTSRVWGTSEGIAFEGMVEGPSTEAAPLQVACVFEYVEGDIFDSPPALPAAANGMLHLDTALHGVITELRKSGRFRGHSLETLLLKPPRGVIAAERVLLIGLGDRRSFTPDLMVAVGRVAMREALRLGVTHYAFASDLKDAGIDSPTGVVAANVVRGSVEAYRTERYLESKGMADLSAITRVTLLAGPAYFRAAGEGIKAALLSLEASAR